MEEDDSVSLIRNDRIVRRQERIDVMDDRGMDELPSGWTTGAAKGIAAHRHSP